MATKKTVIELTTTGGDKVKIDFDQIGEKAQRALRRIADSATPANAGLKALDASVGELKSKASSLAAELGPVGRIISSLGPAGLAVGAAVGGVVAMGGAFAVSARSAIDYASAIKDASERTGLATDTLQELAYAAAQAGISSESLDGALSTFAKNVGEAKNGTGKLVASLKDHNAALLENIRNTTSQDAALQLALDAINGTADAAEKAALQVAFFGKSGKELAFLSNNLAAVRQEARDLGAVMGAELIDRADEVGDKFTKLSLILKTQFFSAVLEAAPLLDTLANALLNVAAASKGIFFPEQFIADARKNLGYLNTALAENSKQLADLSADYAKASTGGFGRGGADAFERRGADLVKQREGILAALAEVERKAAAAPVAGPKPAALRETLADQKAREEAAKRFESEQKQAAADLARFQEQAAKAGLTAEQKVFEEREQNLAKVAEIEKKYPALAQESADARVAITEAAERQITKIHEDEEKKRQDASAKAQEILAGIEGDLTASTQTESEARKTIYDQETQKILDELAIQLRAKGETEAEITRITQKASDDRTKTYANEAKKASESFTLAFSDIGARLATGLLTGEGKWKDGLDLLKQEGINAFGDIIKHKLEKFDPTFEHNFVTDLPGFISEFASKGLGTIGGFFSDVLGLKGSFDQKFGSSGIGSPNGVAAGEGGFNFAGFATGLAGTAGAAGGAYLGAKAGGKSQAGQIVGGIAGAALGNLFASNAFSYALTGQLTPFTQAMILKLAPALAQELGIAATQAAAQAGITGIGMTLADGTVIASGAAAEGAAAAASGTTVGGAAGGAGGAAGGGAAGGLGAGSWAAIYAAAAIVVDQLLTRTGATTSGSRTVRGLAQGLDQVVKPAAVQDFLKILSGDFKSLKFGETLKNTIGDALLPGIVGVLNGLGAPSKAQYTRRGLQGLLGQTAAIGSLGKLSQAPEDVLGGEFKGDQSIFQRSSEFLEKFPGLSKEALAAAEAFAFGVASKVKTPLKDDFLEASAAYADLIAHLGEGGVTSEEALRKIAVAAQELGISFDDQAIALKKAFDDGKLGLDEFVAGMQALEEASRNSFDIIEATANERLGKISKDARGMGTVVDRVFQAAKKAGITSFAQFTNASTTELDDLNKTIEALGPSGRRVFDVLKTLGIISMTDLANASLEQIQKIIEALSGIVFPEVPEVPGAVPPAPGAPAPPGPAGQAGFAEGGYIPGPLGMAMPVIAHGGELVVSNRDLRALRGGGDARVAGLLTELIREVRSQGRSRGDRVVVEPVLIREKLYDDLQRGERENRLRLRGQPVNVPGLRTQPVGGGG